VIPFGVHLGFCFTFLVSVLVVYSFFVFVFASVARAFQQVLLFASPSIAWKRICCGQGKKGEGGGCVGG
jgi:hypothetical protein